MGREGGDGNLVRLQMYVCGVTATPGSSYDLSASGENPAPLPCLPSVCFCQTQKRTVLAIFAKVGLRTDKHNLNISESSFLTFLSLGLNFWEVGVQIQSGSSSSFPDRRGGKWRGAYGVKSGLGLPTEKRIPMKSWTAWWC